MLNKELSLVYDGDKINSQITEYICSFLDQDEQIGDSQMPCGSGSGGTGDKDDTESVVGVPSPSSCTSTPKCSNADQKTITAKNAADVRKIQQQSQQITISPKSSVIVRLDKNMAKKLAAVTAEVRFNQCNPHLYHHYFPNSTLIQTWLYHTIGNNFHLVSGDEPPEYVGNCPKGHSVHLEKSKIGDL